MRTWEVHDTAASRRSPPAWRCADLLGVDLAPSWRRPPVTLLLVTGPGFGASRHAIGSSAPGLCLVRGGYIAPAESEPRNQAAPGPWRRASLPSTAGLRHIACSSRSDWVRRLAARGTHRPVPCQPGPAARGPTCCRLGAGAEGGRQPQVSLMPSGCRRRTCSSHVLGPGLAWLERQPSRRGLVAERELRQASPLNASLTRRQTSLQPAPIVGVRLLRRYGVSGSQVRLTGRQTTASPSSQTSTPATPLSLAGSGALGVVALHAVAGAVALWAQYIG